MGIGIAGFARHRGPGPPEKASRPQHKWGPVGHHDGPAGRRQVEACAGGERSFHLKELPVGLRVWDFQLYLHVETLAWFQGSQAVECRLRTLWRASDRGKRLWVSTQPSKCEKPRDEPRLLFIYYDELRRGACNISDALCPRLQML